jgi:chemosensory pili system protein ChpC
MSERDAEIYCLLVPLVDERLIIPRSCVAEVISYQAPAEMTGAPPWYLGVVNWNGRHVPLISFEGCCGENIPPASSRSRVVILHAVSPKVETGYFALISQGFPQLVRAGRELLKPDVSRSFPERSPILCQIRLLNEAPLVPDLVRLEGMVAEETTILPP